jgi:hypothetical protein
MTTPDLPITLKVYAADGTTLLCEYPYFTNLQTLDVLNDVGSFAFDWNLNSPGSSNLVSDTALQVAICMDARDGNGFQEVGRYLYEQDTYDVSMSESATVQANGRSMVAILEQAVVYPIGGAGSIAANYPFTGATPGKIMHDLIVAAQARGCFPSLSMSFTTGADSSGNAWTQSFTYAYNIGTSLLDVLLGLAQVSLCDFSMSGTTLNMYNPRTTLANDFSSSVFIRRGRDAATIPFQRDRTQLGTAMLTAGDNGVNVERTATTLGTLGRYERYLAQSGITNVGTLEYFADQALGAVDDQQIAYTPSYIISGNGSPIPWKDYKAGDYVSIDLSGTPVKYRVRQFATQLTAGGPISVQPTLNDVFYDRNVIQEGKIHSLTNGSITGATGVAVLPGPNATIPNPPTFGTAYTGAYYSPATGTTLAQLELSWSTPTNTDGTLITDGQNFVIQYRIATTPIYPIAWSQLQGKPWSSINGNPWSNPLATPQNTQWTTMTVPFDQNNAIVSGLICGETYQFQIATTDVSGNTSAFSSITPFTTATDNVAPSQPDAPQVAASMVAVQVTHDLGQASGGTYNLEQDLDHLEVHFSYDPSFTPIPGVTSNTYLGKLIANAGLMGAKIAAVGTFNVTSTTGIYIKVIAVDESGNSSPPSPGSGVTAVLIDDQHISSLSVSKLLAGTVMANIVLGGVIATSLTGQRVQMDSTGVHAYDALGNITFDLNSGTPVITLGSNASGAKITLDTSPGYPTINFYDASATNHASILAFSVGSGSGSNTAGIQMISGIYTVTSGTYAGSYQNLLSMQGDNGIELAVVDSSGSFVVNGGGIGLTPSFASLGIFREAATHGGQILFSYDSGSTDSTWELDGFVFNNNAPFSQVGGFPSSYGGLTAGASGASLGYGATMYSGVLTIASYSCGTTTTIPASDISAQTTTGFAISLSAAAPASWSTFFTAWRVR